MTVSLEYMEEILANAKKLLPGWQYAMLRRVAQPAAGGRAAHRVLEPSTLEKLALASISPETLQECTDDALEDVWGRLRQLYLNAKKRRQAVASYLETGLKARRELEHRGRKFGEGDFVSAVAEFEQKTDGPGKCEELPREEKRDFAKAAGAVPSSGPDSAVVAFVGASPSRVEAARREPFVGPVGETFNKLYLTPLGIERDRVLLANVVPELLIDDRGQAREPVRKEVDEWAEWFDEELRTRRPQVIVALGKTASEALGDRAAVTLPHPAAVRRFGDSGEVGRKIKRIIQIMKEAPSEDEAEKNWSENWFKVIPRTGKGRFVYQHHWRGLAEDEVDKSDEDLIRGEHSLHGDLRLEGVDELWGFTLFLGETKNNRGEHSDRFLDLGDEEKIRLVPKLGRSKIWLDAQTRKSLVIEPGGPGATSDAFAKIIDRDQGTFELGVVREGSVEIFLDGEYLNGRYLILRAPANGERFWLIQKPKEQTPSTERLNLADVIGELKSKGQRFLFWGTPGERPKWIDTETGREVTKKFAYDGKTKISKANPVKRIVYGVVLDPYGSKGNPELDAHRDWPSPLAVENTAHRFQKGERRIKLQHKDDANATLLETWIEPYPSRKDYLAAMRGDDHAIYRRPFGTDYIHSGSWGIAVELGPKEWEEYEDKVFNAFSPGGMGVKKPLAIWQLPKVEIKELKA